MFINLTSGLEAIDRLKLDPQNISFIRIQSSHCEEHCWEQILDELDSNFLMCAALGIHCVVFDSGSQNDFSKAIYFGLEWIKFVLNKRWFGRNYIPNVKGKDTTEYFVQEYAKLTRKCKKRLDYFKKFLIKDAITIEGRSEKGKHDNDYDYFRMMIGKYL
jgi:hypothetical protein